MKQNNEGQKSKSADNSQDSSNKKTSNTPVAKESSQRESDTQKREQKTPAAKRSK